MYNLVVLNYESASPAVQDPPHETCKVVALGNVRERLTWIEAHEFKHRSCPQDRVAEEYDGHASPPRQRRARKMAGYRKQAWVFMEVRPQSIY